MHFRFLLRDTIRCFRYNIIARCLCVSNLYSLSKRYFLYTRSHYARGYLQLKYELPTEIILMKSLYFYSSPLVVFLTVTNLLLGVLVTILKINNTEIVHHSSHLGKLLCCTKCPDFPNTNVCIYVVHVYMFVLTNRYVEHVT